MDMPFPSKSYIIACTPRSGSHFLADALAQTGLAGYPDERFPRPSEHIPMQTATGSAALLLDRPSEASYDDYLDAEYVARVIDEGTTPNRVFGLKIHHFQMDDAVRRIRAYSKSKETSHQKQLSSALPNLSYIWLRRRDKIAQAVSWHKAVQSGKYIRTIRSAELTSKDYDNLAFDYKAIRTYWSALRSSDSSWSHFFSDVDKPPLVIWYEDLSEAYEATIRGALKYLGVEYLNPSMPLSAHVKAADAHSLGWIERFKRMKAQST
jgi:LPS sulfotransferase NodH